MSKEEHYIFELTTDFLQSLELLHFDEFLSIVDVKSSKATEKPEETREATKVKNLTECSACRLGFGDEIPQQERSSHYKSDLHRLNLKRSVKGLRALQEAEFEEFLETQSIESISGSEDSDSDSDTDFVQDRLPTVFEKLSTEDPLSESNEERHASHMNTHSPFVMFKSSVLDDSKGFGAYKAVFDDDTLNKGEVVEALTSFNSSSSRQGLSVLLMIGGGHFAGAVISHQRTNTKGNTKNQKESLQAQRVAVVESKTFHRYTTRRKQGGSQSASDNARGKANSAGSSIRRYNEQALKKDVHDLLQSWSSYLAQAQHIFIRASGADGMKTLMGYEGSILKHNDTRVKSFPFTTKRATLSEVKNSWTKLTYLNILDLPKAKKIVQRPPKENKPDKVSETVREPESDIHTREVIALLKKSKAPFLVNYVKNNGLDIDLTFTPESRYGHTPTPLHYASWQGLQHMVKLLLTNLRADPTKVNVSGKTPYQISTSREVKSMFQICRSNLGENYCDWEAAKVGPPKTSEEVAAENAKEKEIQNAESRRLIEEELAKKTDFESKPPPSQHGGRVGGGNIFTSVSATSGLTDQQKMRMMREQRARAAEARIKRGGQ